MVIEYVKQLEHEVDHPPSYDAEAKNSRIFMSLPPIHLYGWFLGTKASYLYHLPYILTAFIKWCL